MLFFSHSHRTTCFLKRQEIEKPMVLECCNASGRYALYMCTSQHTTAHTYGIRFAQHGRVIPYVTKFNAADA